MFHRSGLLLWSVIAVSSGSDNKTDLADYTLVGDNITELNLTSLNTEYAHQEDIQEEDLENDAPIDTGRRKGKIQEIFVETDFFTRNLRNCERNDLYLYIPEFVSSLAFLKVTGKSLT